MTTQQIKSPILKKSLQLLEKYLKDTPPEVLKKDFEEIQNDESVGGITVGEYLKLVKLDMRRLEKSTGKFDCNNKELFVGDKVIHSEGFCTHNKKPTPLNVISTIKLVKDNGNRRFCLGNAYNSWKGKHVQKLTKKQVKEMGMPEDHWFIFDENFKPCKAVLYSNDSIDEIRKISNNVSR